MSSPIRGRFFSANFFPHSSLDAIKDGIQLTNAQLVSKQFWAQICLDTNCAFVNCIPSFIASNDEWGKKFAEKNLPLIGDDIKGQVGATIVHRTLARLCDDRGTKIEKTYQINVGGNTDFLNMKEQERLV